MAAYNVLIKANTIQYYNNLMLYVDDNAEM